MPSKAVNCYQLAISHLEIWSVQWNKTEFLPSSGCVSTTLWMYHMDVDQTNKEKARQKLHKNVTCYTEQIFETTPHEIASVWPLIPISKTIKMRRARHEGLSWRSKNELRSNILLWTPSQGHACVDRPTRTYQQQTQDVVLETCWEQ